MRYVSQLFPYRRWTAILGGTLLVVIGGLYFFHAAVKTESVGAAGEQNLVNGRLAFNHNVVGPGPNRYIETTNPDGSEGVTIGGSNMPFNPAWSPDGARIAYNTSQTGVGDICVIGTDGSGETNLTNTAGISENFPSWSATGKIAYERGGQIWTMNADGTGQAQFTAITQPLPTRPSWSPDGSKLAFSNGSDIWVINADGTNQVQVTTTATTDTDPTWSPDGAKIAFKKGNVIASINLNGTNEIPLTSGSNDREPAWSPDGAKIAYRGTSGLWTMNADGTNQVRIITDFILFPLCCDHLFEYPAWQPFSQIPTTYGISGRVTNGGVGMEGVTINLSMFGAPTSAATTTDSMGNYQFTGLEGGINYVISPTSPGRYFTPASRIFYNLTSNRTGDFGFLTTSRPTAFDFNGDGRSDMSVFRPSNGLWYLYGIAGKQWGISTDTLAPADYDGDRKTDFAVWRSSDGNFWIFNSSTSTVRFENFGLPGDIPTGGDWDGDGKADVAVYRGGAQSVFYYRSSIGNPQSNITSIPWGITGDKPVAGDYDGDGLTDAAIYRAGIWYIRQSSNGQLFAASFGLANDRLVPADYDGDGRTDIAVFRDGIWYQLRSTQGFVAFQYGVTTDVLAPADYDGDGRTDAAVFRGGTWWILSSQSGFSSGGPFGNSGDKPIANAYVR